MLLFEINVFNFALCFNAEELYQNADVSQANDTICDIKTPCFYCVSKKLESDTSLVSYQITNYQSDPQNMQ